MKEKHNNEKLKIDESFGMHGTGRFEYNKEEMGNQKGITQLLRSNAYVISCIKNEEIKPANYVTHRVLFDEVGEEFESWLDPSNGVIKAMIEMSKTK